MMAGTVKVHWCPSCKSWSKHAAGARLITVDPAMRYRLGAVDVDCLQESHQCGNCEAHLLTLRTTSQDHPMFSRPAGAFVPSLIETADCSIRHASADTHIERAAA